MAIEDKMCRRDRDGQTTWLILLPVMLLGGVVRYIDIDAPPMRWDELVVPLAASRPLEYLIEWCMRCEVHPPGFYLLIKAFLLGGHDDFFVRLPAFLSGMVLIGLVYKVLNELVSSSAAFIAAALVASDPFLILFSRMVRPYTLWLCLLTLSCLFFIRFTRTSSNACIVKILACNLVAYCIHFLSIIVFPAQVVAYFILNTSLKSTKIWKIFATVLIPFLVVLPFVIGLQAREPVSGALPYGTVLDTLGKNILKSFFPFYNSVTVQIIFAIATVCGLLVLWKTRKELFWLIVCTICFPLVVVVAFRYGSYESPWHMVFIPFFSIFAISSLFTNVPKPLLFAAAATVLGGNVFALSREPAQYIYSPDNAYEGSFTPSGLSLKSFAAHLPRYVADGSYVRVDHGTNYYSTNWYINLVCPFLDISHNTLTADRSSTLVTTLSKVISAEDGESIAEFPPFSVLRKEFLRNSPLLLRNNEVISLSSHPESFFGNVHELNNITLFADRGYSINPSCNGDTSYFTYKFHNEGLPKQSSLLIQPHFYNHIRNGKVVIEAQFDQENPETLMVNEGVELPPKRDFTLQNPILYVKRLKPFSTLILRVKFTAPLTTPGYPGGNLSGISLWKLDVTPGIYSTDLFDTSNLDKEMFITGLQSVEKEKDNSWRWAMGPETVIRFSSPGERKASLRFDLTNIMPDQNIQIEINGEPVKHVGPLPAGKWLTPDVHADIPFTVNKGVNTIRFIYSSWNSPANPVLQDPSPYSVVFTRLAVE